MTPFENSPDLEKFSHINEFCGAFRTSAKTGFGIDKAMKFIINNIIQRFEAFLPPSEFEALSTEKIKSCCLSF